MSVLNKLYTLLFPQQAKRSAWRKEVKLREAHWDRLAEEEYQVWLKGGKEAWREWRKEQTRKRVEADKSLPEPLRSLREHTTIDREVQYPPLSPKERKAERKRQKEWDK